MQPVLVSLEMDVDKKEGDSTDPLLSPTITAGEGEVVPAGEAGSIPATGATADEPKAVKKRKRQPQKLGK